MECLEFRRQLGAEPRRESAEMSAHRQACSGCAEAHARALGFELQLRRALSIPAPAGFADRILLAQATAERRERGSQRRRFGVIAAAAAVIVAVGVGGLWRVRSAEAFPALMVDHLKHEPEAFESQAPLPSEDVRQHFDRRGVRLAAAPPAGVSYASNCPVGPYKSVHMVMPEQAGPVTVLFITDHRERRRDDFRREHWEGRSVPMGDGTLVMLAHDTRMFDALEASWRHSIEGDVNSAVGAF